MAQHEHSGDCKQIFAALSEYLDMTLPVESCADLEEHLKDCPPCIEFLNSLRQTVSLCKDCEPAEKPAPLSGDSRDRLRAAYQKALAARAGGG